MKDRLTDYTLKPLQECTPLELFNAVLKLTQQAAEEKGYNTGKKKLYYLSAEFLIGKLMSNNLINLGLYDSVRQQLSDAGRSLEQLEEFESEPSLGNGGLGRLAACFLDSLATLGLPADGVGLAYHCGLFRQTFENGTQKEIPDYWLHWGQESWMHRTEKRYAIPFGSFTVTGILYEITVTGYHARNGRLRLFDIDTADERLIHDGIRFDKKQYAKNLTLFLYPDDSDEDGRLLRVYQEFFLAACAARLILDEAQERGTDFHDLPDYAAVQINDTHASMVIPQLILLLEEKGIEFDEALSLVTQMCGYTNHTILAEALEKWPESFLQEVSPQTADVIRQIDKVIKKKAPGEETAILDRQHMVHMASLCIHCSHSVNGVARLHTQILKNSELKAFSSLYPDRFNNKTNGITFRRWLMECNPRLSGIISSRIGTGWKMDPDQLSLLGQYLDDQELLGELLAAKTACKQEFSDYLEAHQGLTVNVNSVFDVQAKRLHEYKRQQMNLLWAVRLYQQIKEGYRPVRPVTVIFGAKAAPAYVTAKDIIAAILAFTQVVRQDSQAREYLNVVMLENYNVTAAEKVIPACDISEQISLASKEASGTSNMKFMLNGAVTLGTMDGANVEISDLVGPENIYTFGASSDEVIARYQKGDYVSRDYYEHDKVLARTVDFLISGPMLQSGCEQSLRRLYEELLNKDYFMTFPDFEDYCRVKDRMLSDYEDSFAWAKKMLVNISKAGYFSSDRTIREYNKDIWHLAACPRTAEPDTDSASPEP